MDTPRLLVALACSVLLACGDPPAQESASGTTSAETTTTSASTTAASSSSSGETGSEGPTPWSDYAEAECAAYAACGCPAPQGLGADLEACIATRRGALAAVADEGKGSWDPECAAQRLAAIQTYCEEGERECAGLSCSLFVGVGEAGSACTSAGDWSECAAPWSCYGGTCMEYCPSACSEGFCGAGTRCFCDYLGACYCAADAAEGEACSEQLGPLCGPGLECDGISCVAEAGLGEPCVGYCEPGLYCSSDGLCVPLGAGGEPCEQGYTCASYLCTDLTCAPLAQEGESCPFGVPFCEEGLECLTLPRGEGICVLPLPVGAECEYYQECEGWAYCTDGRCVPQICDQL